MADERVAVPRDQLAAALLLVRLSAVVAAAPPVANTCRSRRPVSFVHIPTFGDCGEDKHCMKQNADPTTPTSPSTKTSTPLGTGQWAAARVPSRSAPHTHRSRRPQRASRTSPWEFLKVVRDELNPCGVEFVDFIHAIADRASARTHERIAFGNRMPSFFSFLSSTNRKFVLRKLAAAVLPVLGKRKKAFLELELRLPHLPSAEKVRVPHDVWMCVGGGDVGRVVLLLTVPRITSW